MFVMVMVFELVERVIPVPAPMRTAPVTPETDVTAPPAMFESTYVLTADWVGIRIVLLFEISPVVIPAPTQTAEVPS